LFCHLALSPYTAAVLFALFTLLFHRAVVMVLNKVIDEELEKCKIFPSTSSTSVQLKGCKGYK
jgi:hypothetical protein